MCRNGIVVVDLDGTLLRCNSFHKYIVYLLTSPGCGLYYLNRVKILFYLALRLTRMITHKKLKLWLMQLSTEIDDSIVKDFVNKVLVKDVSKVCIDEINYWKTNNVQLILATAAPVKYASYISKLFGFDKVFASDLLETGELYECFRDIKAKCIADYAKNSEILAVYSDHQDDAELFKLSKECILVNPVDKNVYKLFKDSKIVIQRVIRDDL